MKKKCGCAPHEEKNQRMNQLGLITLGCLHIKKLKGNCYKILNIHALKVLSHTSWCIDQTTLLILYRSLVRSKLDYDCIRYNSARK